MRRCPHTATWSLNWKLEIGLCKRDTCKYVSLSCATLLYTWRRRCLLGWCFFVHCRSLLLLRVLECCHTHTWPQVLEIFGDGRRYFGSNLFARGWRNDAFGWQHSLAPAHTLHKLINYSSSGSRQSPPPLDKWFGKHGSDLIIPWEMQSAPGVRSD
jgi:hypothetical protein